MSNLIRKRGRVSQKSLGLPFLDNIPFLTKKTFFFSVISIVLVSILHHWNNCAKLGSNLPFQQGTFYLPHIFLVGLPPKLQWQLLLKHLNLTLNFYCTVLNLYSLKGGKCHNTNLANLLGIKTRATTSCNFDQKDILLFCNQHYFCLRTSPLKPLCQTWQQFSVSSRGPFYFPHIFLGGFAANCH